MAAPILRSPRLAGALLAGSLLGSCAPDAAPARPNVVLVTLDTSRADYFSGYGYDLPTTPHFDALMQRGVAFEHCLVSAALTPVSHATILTGLEPYHHGLRVLLAKRGAVLEDEVPTLAETLAQAGYETAAFLSAYPVSEPYGLDQGFATFDSGVLPEGAELPPDDELRGRRQGRTQRRSDLTTERALEWLADAPQPFFLWIHYWDPHDPNTVPPDDALSALKQAAQAANQPAPSLYAQEIRYVDEQFGRLLERLESAALAERTIVAVTADHGEGLGEHGWHAHRLLYEEQLWVPLILAWPGGPRGERVADLVRTTDIVPTVLELCDLPAPRALDGASLVALSRGAREAARTGYAESLSIWDAKDRLANQRPRDALLYAAVRDGWKLIVRPLHPDEPELYDLGQDPDEALDRAAQRPDIVAELSAELESRAPFVLEPLGTEGLDAAADAALSELGYLGDEDPEGPGTGDRGPGNADSEGER